MGSGAIGEIIIDSESIRKLHSLGASKSSRLIVGRLFLENKVFKVEENYSGVP